MIVTAAMYPDRSFIRRRSYAWPAYVYHTICPWRPVRWWFSTGKSLSGSLRCCLTGIEPQLSFRQSRPHCLILFPGLWLDGSTIIILTVMATQGATLCSSRLSRSPPGGGSWRTKLRSSRFRASPGLTYLANVCSVVKVPLYRRVSL